MGKGQATKKPEERRTEKRKRKEVYRNVHKQAVYVLPAVVGLIVVTVVGLVYWATRSPA